VPLQQVPVCPSLPSPAEPSHGVVLFKHHEPLEFHQAALSDLLDASWLWFQASHQLNPAATEPFLLWELPPPRGGQPVPRSRAGQHQVTQG